MNEKISHTIRFDPEEKEKLHELAKNHGHGFQAEMELAVKHYLQNQRVYAFLARVQCVLDAMSVGERAVAMANIATLVGIELE